MVIKESDGGKVGSLELYKVVASYKKVFPDKYPMCFHLWYISVVNTHRNVFEQKQKRLAVHDKDVTY